MDVNGLNNSVDKINHTLNNINHIVTAYNNNILELGRIRRRDIREINNATRFNRYEIDMRPQIIDSFSRILFYLTDNNNPENGISCCSVVFETDKTEEKKINKIIVSANCPREANLEHINNNLIQQANNIINFLRNPLLINEICMDIFWDYLDEIGVQPGFHNFIDRLHGYFNRMLAIAVNGIVDNENFRRIFFKYLDLFILNYFFNRFYFINGQTPVVTIEDVGILHMEDHVINHFGRTFHCETKMALGLREKPNYIGTYKLSCPFCKSVLNFMHIRHRGSHKGFVPSINVWRYPYFRVSGMNQQRATIDFKKWINEVLNLMPDILLGIPVPILNEFQDFPEDGNRNKLEHLNLSDDFPILEYYHDDDNAEFIFMLINLYHAIPYVEAL